MLAQRSLPQPIKWHGGKHYLARRIVALMPPHVHYVEHFAGGLAVLLAKDPEGISEVVNDLDGDLTTFWRVLQHPRQFQEFARVCQATPFSEAEFARAGDGLGEYADPVGRAWAFFVRCRQSLAGRRDTFSGITRTRTRRGMNGETSAWLSAVDGLAAAHDRLRRVLVLNRKALDVIRSQDGPGTLFYCDPPYLPDTRAAAAVYRHEMSAADHRELLAVLRGCRGKVLLGGYPSELYDTALRDWDRHTFDLPNHAAGGKAKGRETEVVWANF